MQPQPTRFLVAQVIDGFMLAKAAEGKSKHTLADYAVCLRRFTTWLERAGRADCTLADVTTDILRAFLASLQGGTLSPKTVKNHHTALSSLWAWSGSEFHVSNPMQGIRTPQAHPPAMQLPTLQDIQRVLKACEYSQEARIVARKAFAMQRPTG
jgi:integrase/recombinase XerD